jgi:hypothetical protein
MSIIITNRSYKRLRNDQVSTFYLGGKDDIVEYSFRVQSIYEFQSSQGLPVEIVAGNQARILGGNWSDYGFLVGDTVTITFIPDSGSFVPANVTIQDVQGDLITFTTSPMSSFVNEIFPGGGNSNFVLTHQATQHPAKLEVLFNLIPNSVNQGVNSLIDGEVNRLEFNAVLSVSGTSGGVIVGNRSGGAIVNSLITRLADVGSIRQFEIKIAFINWLSFDEGDLARIAPYQANETIKTFTRINSYRQATNPNSVLTIDDSNVLGNVGWYNENYNQGNNPFTVTNFTLEDTAGNPLAAIDYAQTTKVKVTVTAGGTFQNEWLIMGYNVPFDDRYKNKPTSFAENVFLSWARRLAAQFQGLNGGNMAISSVSVDVSVFGVASIEFDLVPNAAFTQYFAALPDGDRWYRLSLTLQTTSGSATANDATTLLLYENELQAAPVVGQIASEVDSLTFLIHPEADTAPGVVTLTAMTEDDLLVKGLLKLKKADNYDAINLSFRVVRNSDGAFFNLWSRNIGTAQFPLTNDNKRLLNYVEQLGYNLPNPGRNVLSLIYNGTEDSTTYDVELRHTLLLSWRYWVANPNALADFLDITLPNNGLNDEWVRYAQTGFTFVFRVELVKDGVADYYNAPIQIEDYDSTTVVSDIMLEDGVGNPLPGIVNGQPVTVIGEHVALSAWSQPDVWGWLAIRPRENEPRRLISTVWAWNSLNLPWNPLAGDTEAELTFPSTDTANIKALIPTGNVQQNSTIVTRIAEPMTSKCTSPIEYLFSTIRVNNATQEQRLDAFSRLKFSEGAKGSPLIVPKPNGLCCPLCEYDPESNLTGYFIGSRAWINALEGDGATHCCRNYYPFFEGGDPCNATYRDEVGGLVSFFSGLGYDITPFNTDGLDELNPYFAASFLILKDEMEATFTDIDTLYDAWMIIINEGFYVVCTDEDTIIGIEG